MTVIDKETKQVSLRDVTLAQDEGPRPDTTAEGLAKIKPVFEGKTITAGNASQLSDGASACVVMSDALAAQKGLKPLGIFRGFVTAGVAPDEIGVGPVTAVPRLLERHGLKIDDIDLWELNEAYAVQPPAALMLDEKKLAAFSAAAGRFLLFPIGDRRCNRTRASVGNAGGNARKRDSS